MADLRVKIGNLELKNPVMTASGTFGYGPEYADFVELSEIGGIIVKGTTLHPRQGNDYPRMAETASGMLNCVGLQNKGVDYFCEHIYPEIKDIDTNMIVNVSGSSPEDYAECAARIDALDKIPAIELNISCPNVKDGGMAFGVTCEGAASVVRAVRKSYHKTLIVKLSPNVTDITEIARAVEAEGADSVSLINTLMGMAIDIEKRKPMLSINTGGLSGPAVKPVALRMVWQVAKAVGIPVVGLGGICQMWEDGSAIAFCPQSTYGYPLDTRGVIQHEAGGHGFGKLGDEYIYHNAFIDFCDCTCCGHVDAFNAAKSLGWYDNLELTGKMHSVGWSHLIFDDRYSDIVDIYEGGYMHNRGVFRSEPNSCMNNDIPYYSTISRESIVKRIKAYAGETYSFEDFVKNDKRDAGIVESRAFGGNGDQRTSGTYQHAPIFHKGSPLKMAKVRKHRKSEGKVNQNMDH